MGAPKGCVGRRMRFITEVYHHSTLGRPPCTVIYKEDPEAEPVGISIELACIIREHVAVGAIPRGCPRSMNKSRYDERRLPSG